MQALETKYGKEKFGRALKVATLVFEANSLESVETLIALEEKYGMDALTKAVKLVSEMSADNPKRSIEYLAGIVQNERG